MQPSRAIARRAGRELVLLALAGAGLVAAYALAPSGLHARAVLSDAVLAGVIGLGAWVLQTGPARSSPRRRPLVALLVAGALLKVGLLVRDILQPHHHALGGPTYLNAPFFLIPVLVLIALREELLWHFRPEDRREAVADIVLITAACAGVAYLLMRPETTSSVGGSDLTSAAFAVAVVAPVAWGALVVWAPSLVHLGLFCSMSALFASSYAFGHEWVRNQYVSGQTIVDVPMGLSLLALAALLTAESAATARRPEVVSHRWGRQVLTIVAVTAGCASLALTAAMETAGRGGPLETAVLVALIATAVAARIFMNQIRTGRATDDTARALAEKDATLRDTDAAFSRLREAHESLAASEARMRLLLDVAVDGIVELDGSGVIRRANEAFCTMTELPLERIIGRTWEEVAGEVPGGGPDLASLPETGHALLKKEGHEVHLAGRSSELPGPDAGRLLVIRDVSADKVAEMTIRSLFKFLQDRDEDRSRLLRRTNAAIESERNRIARDLHDGPVQGLSAASLSLEAVLLMLRTGDVEGGVEMLAKIREELSEEAEALRRLMADLRPPVLEERGLIPALRDTLARWGRDFGVQTHFHSRSLVDVPADLETLAYRIVQEALTNAAKHSRSTDVTVTVEAESGQLRVEVEDNGTGFDVAKARDFLRMGRVGLASMRERTELASGTFMVRSSPGSGTSVVASLPLEITPIRSEAVLG